MVFPVFAGSPQVPLLKAFGTPVHAGISSQVTSATITSANVKAGGVVFAWVREPDNQTAMAAPSGWTEIAQHYVNSRGCAIFYKLTPSAVDTTITFPSGKVISLFSVYAEDESAALMPITGISGLADDGFIAITSETSINNSLANSAGDIHSLTCAYAADTSYNIGTSVASIDAFPFFTSGAAGVYGKMVSDPRLIPDTGNLGWSISSATTPIYGLSVHFQVLT